MLDIRKIRQDPALVGEALRRLHAEAPIDEILELDSRRREILQELEGLRHERKTSSEQIGRMKEGAERQPLVEAGRGGSSRAAASTCCAGRGPRCSGRSSSGCWICTYGMDIRRSTHRPSSRKSAWRGRDSWPN